MLLITGSFRIDSASLKEALPIMARMIAASRAEPGCIEYSYAADLIDPGLIRVAECWTDADALDAHFASAHLAEWRAAWGDLGIGERDLRLYESPGPQPV